MKFEELSQHLSTHQFLPGYIINGGESYLTTTALKQIEQALQISLPDFNKQIFGDDFSKSAKDIVADAQALPIVDAHRLIVVHDYLGKKNEEEKKTFEKYFQNPNPSTCIVFFSTQKSEFFASLEPKVQKIECEKLSPHQLFAMLREMLQKHNLVASQQVQVQLVDYVSSSITKLSTEVEKLASTKAGCQNREITATDVETYVAKDIEYVIFDLTQAISQKDGNKAYVLIDAMLKNKEQPVAIISIVSNHFRRLFFAARSELATANLASTLGIKEFAAQKYRQQAKAFSQKQLKNIFDKCVEVEFLVKSGKMDAKNAVYFLVANILSLSQK